MSWVTLQSPLTEIWLKVGHLLSNFVTFLDSQANRCGTPFVMANGEGRRISGSHARAAKKLLLNLRFASKVPSIAAGTSVYIQLHIWD